MNNIESIFDGVFEEEKVKPPIAVLKELALALARKTKGLLTGNIRLDVDEQSGFELTFSVTANVLNGFTLNNSNVKYGIALYPAAVSPLCVSPRPPIGHYIADTEEELIGLIKTILETEKIKKTITALMAHASV